MSSPTEEQKKAIEATGSNVIVSAGAGSGKTFVLKSRVQRKVINETTVDKLIILTFTNAAAQEMKDRIRKVILNTPEAKDQLDYVESAYITTFDSFAQSLVKKYNYLLNIDKHFTIIDENIVNTELTKIATNIFNEYYENPTDEFKNFINDYCYKDDEGFIYSIVDMYGTLVNLKNKKEFLDTYINKYFNEEHIKDMLQEYKDLIVYKAYNLIPLYDKLIDHMIDDNAIAQMEERKEAISSATYPEEIIEIINKRKPQNSKNKQVYDEEDLKSLKEFIRDSEGEIKDLASLSDDDLIKQYDYTKNNVQFLIKILTRLDKEIMTFKEEHNSYEFQDIALKAIELVRDHEDVRDEIKYNTNEIMIDEYQDTNDIQEEFISYISNNNVYMVGDVKQSIYRFRHANPYIFKDKYDKYATGKDGIKIDMTKNFRSRNEVIKNINDIFSSIMFDDIGGADYKKDHQMEAKFEPYNNYKVDDFNYNLKVLNYEIPTSKEFTRQEIEAFIIADDIEKKMKSNMFIVDGDGNRKELEFSDFCILIDKSTNFDLIKKILEYKNIPSTIFKELSIKEDDEVFILKNLITLLISIKNNKLDATFRHSFMSILRSYIFRTNDNDIFDIYHNESFKETELYKKLESISLSIDGLSNKEILIKLIDEFDMFNKLILVGDIKDRSSKLEYFINNADSLNKFGLDIYSLNEYFDRILNSDDDLKMGGNGIAKNSVKIMTIHKSKGLEFPFVYLPYLNSGFISRKETRYPLSEKYGIILPYNEDKIIDNTFVKKIYDFNNLKETISEKIRLLYVAITRAREQFILINSWNNKLEPINNISSLDLLKCRSYTDILSIMKNSLMTYTNDINLDDINLSKDYNLYSNANYNSLIKDTSKVISTKKLDIDYKLLENKHFSKALTKIMDKSFKELLDFGTMMHYCFEVYDFQNNNLDDINISDEYKNNIRNFLNHDEVKNISNAITYKEHEILFNKDGSIFHGFIDLLVEYDDHFDIIDYKLSNIDSEEYVNQLSGYKEYIESTYNKPCNMYLYSIKKDKFKKL